MGGWISQGYENTVSYFNAYYNAKTLFDEAEAEVLAAQSAMKSKPAASFAPSSGYPGASAYPGTQGYPGAPGSPGTQGFPGAQGFPSSQGFPTTPAPQTYQSPVPQQTSSSSKQKFAAVIDKCSNILSFYPKSSVVDDALFLIGKSYFYQDEYVRAERKFSELIVQDPNGPLSHTSQLWLLKTLQRLLRFDDANRVGSELVDASTKAEETEIEGEALELLGDIAVAQKKPEAALEFYTRAVAASGNGPIKSTAQAKIGDVYVSGEQYDKAAPAYAEVSKYSPDPYGLYSSQLQAAIAYRKIGQYDTAVEILRALESDYRFMDFWSTIRLELAETFAANHKLDEAADLYRLVDTTYARTEQGARAAFDLGRLLQLQRGDYANAKTAYSHATVGGPQVLTQEAQRLTTALDKYFRLSGDFMRMDSIYFIIDIDSLWMKVDSSGFFSRKAAADSSVLIAKRITADSLALLARKATLDSLVLLAKKIPTDSLALIARKATLDSLARIAKKIPADSLALIAQKGTLDSLAFIAKRFTADSLALATKKSTLDSLAVSTTRRIMGDSLALIAKKASLDSLTLIVNGIIPDSLALAGRRVPSDSLTLISAKGAADSIAQNARDGALDSLALASRKATTDSSNIAVKRDSLDGLHETPARQPGKVADVPSADSTALKRDRGAVVVRSDEFPMIIVKPRKDTLVASLGNLSYQLGDLFYTDLDVPDSTFFWLNQGLKLGLDSTKTARALFVLAEVARANPEKKYGDEKDIYRRVVSNYPRSSYAEEARIALGFPPTPKKVDPAAAMFVVAESLMYAGKYQPAVDSLTSIVKAYPDSPLTPKSRYMMAWIYEHDLAKPDSAISQFKALVAKYPSTKFGEAAQRRIPPVEADTSKKPVVEPVKKPAADSAASLQSAATRKVSADTTMKSLPKIPTVADSLRDLDERPLRGNVAKDTAAVRRVKKQIIE
jgi:tetratricopeptide (TPR) repeat protein